MHSLGSGLVANWSVMRVFLSLEETDLIASATFFPVCFAVFTFSRPVGAKSTLYKQNGYIMEISSNEEMKVC